MTFLDSHCDLSVDLQRAVVTAILEHQGDLSTQQMVSLILEVIWRMDSVTDAAERNSPATRQLEQDIEC